MPTVSSAVRVGALMLAIAFVGVTGIATADAHGADATAHIVKHAARSTAKPQGKKSHVERRRPRKHHTKRHHVRDKHKRRAKRARIKRPTTRKPTVSASATQAGPIALAGPTSASGFPQPVGIPGTWNIALNSEFDGTSLDTSVWRAGWFGAGVTGPVNGNEIACYSPSNVTFPGDGTMHLAVTHTTSTCNGVTQPYSGALVSTNPADGRPSGGFQYTYGVVEARVYIPADGTQVADWPAVWADGQNWPADGEDDVMEGLNGSACWTFHDPLGQPSLCDTTLTPGWHTFASDWQPGSVTYYYDGAEVGSVSTGVTSSPMYVVLDDTVHSGYTSTTSASAMQVQYVRVWQAA